MFLSDAVLTDTLTNLVSGLGTAKDKLTAGRFAQRILARTELDALYTDDWIAGTIVDAPADDATRAWREWQAGPKQTTAIEAAEKALGVRHKVRQALKQARLFGTSYLLLGDGAAQPDLPLALDRLRKGGLRYLHVFSDQELVAGPIEDDVVSPWYGEPRHYDLRSGTTAQVQIHPSRVIRLCGLEQIERRQINAGGLSVLQRVYDAVTHAATVTSGLASLSTEAKVDIIHVAGLTENVRDPDYRAKVLARFTLANTAKSINNALLLDATETWTQRQINLSGWPEVVGKFLDIAAGAAGIPVSRLLGKAPSGLTANGENDTRAYYDKLSSWQASDLTPALERLDEALIRHALGVRPPSVWYRWASLWQLTDTERADLDKKRAETVAIYAGIKALPPSALRAGIRNMLIEAGTFPGLEAALAAADAEKEAPDAIAATAPKPAPSRPAGE